MFTETWLTKYDEPIIYLTNYKCSYFCEKNV